MASLGHWPRGAGVHDHTRQHRRRGHDGPAPSASATEGRTSSQISSQYIAAWVSTDSTMLCASTIRVVAEPAQGDARPLQTAPPPRPAPAVGPCPAAARPRPESQPTRQTPPPPSSPPPLGRPVTLDGWPGCGGGRQQDGPLNRGQTTRRGRSHSAPRPPTFIHVSQRYRAVTARPVGRGKSARVPGRSGQRSCRTLAPARDNTRMRARSTPLTLQATVQS